MLTPMHCQRITAASASVDPMLCSAVLHQSPACSPVPGYVSQVIYKNDLGAGWGWRPYNSKNTEVRSILVAAVLGIVAAATALCTVLLQQL